MAKKKDLRDELRSYRLDYDLIQKIPCSEEENKLYEQMLKDGMSLPEGVYAYVYDNGEESTKEFYTIYESDLTDKEMAEYLTYKKLGLLRTIKNCLLFFTALTVIGLIIGFIGYMS